MKIILSRKGFDGGYGGVASPIFRKEDETLGLYSLPIPHEAATCSYADLQWNGGNLQQLIASLRRRHRKGLADAPHLDPDLVRALCKIGTRTGDPSLGRRTVRKDNCGMRVWVRV
jgi:hypothetical protein